MTTRTYINKALVKLNFFEGRNINRIQSCMEDLREAKRAIYMEYKFDMITKSTYTMYMRRIGKTLRRLEHAKSSMLR